MHISDLRKLSSEELAQREQELRRELLGLRFKHATGELENVSQLRTTRKQIAQVATLLNEQKISAEGTKA